MKRKYHSDYSHHLPTKMAIILGTSKIMIGVSILLAFVLLTIFNADININ